MAMVILFATSTVFFLLFLRPGARWAGRRASKNRQGSGAGAGQKAAPRKQSSLWILFPADQKREHPIEAYTLFLKLNYFMLLGREESS